MCSLRRNLIFFGVIHHILPHITDANISEADITKASITEANIAEAHISEASITEANIAETHISEANLTKAA